MFDRLDDILEFLRLVYRSTQVPLVLLEDRRIHTAFYPFQMPADLAYICLMPYSLSPSSIDYLNKNGYFCGTVHLGGTGFSVMAGPVPTVAFHDKEIDTFMEDLNLDFMLRKDIRQWFHRVPVMTQAHFLSVLHLLNHVLNQEGSSVSALNDQEESTFNVEDVRLREPETHVVHTSREIESRLLWAITHGDQDRLLSLLHELRFSEASPGYMSASAMQNLRYTFVAAATVCARAVYQSGVDYEHALTTSDRYIYQMDRCENMLEIYPLLGVMMLDFCEKVSQVIREGDQSALSSHIRKYVQAHLHEPLRVEEIAEHLGKSASHLSHTFTADTGKTIRQYITEEKVAEARRQLAATDRSISEIADDLSFSSQQYFQTVFKKCTGITPGEYRMKKK